MSYKNKLERFAPLYPYRQVLRLQPPGMNNLLMLPDYNLQQQMLGEAESAYRRKTNTLAYSRRRKKVFMKWTPGCKATEHNAN